MYAIGEFSFITGITTKALRHYDEIGLLTPAKRDEINNYRFYTEDQIEIALMIVELKEVGFSLDETKMILGKVSKKDELVKLFHEQKEKLGQAIEDYSAKVKKIEKIVEERDKTSKEKFDLNIQEKVLPDLLIAGIRHKGRYKEIGPLFSKICRACGMKIAGTPFSMHYDQEYKEEDADFEAAIPIKSKIDQAGIKVRELKGGRAITLIHKGHYEAIGMSYKKIIDYLQKHQIKAQIPSREVYLKGPGFFFRNPRKYVTEIQFLLGCG